MRTTVRLTSVGALIAAVPTLLGFHPSASLVLVGAIGRRVGLSMRLNLPPAHEVDAYAQCLAETIPAGAALDTAALIVINPAARWDVTTAVSVELAERDIRVHTAAWAESTQARAAWECAGGCHKGRLPDPALTEFGTVAAVNGRVVLPNREAVTASVQPTAADALERRIVLLRQAASAGEFAPVHRAIVDAEKRRLTLDDARVVQLTQALAHPAVQDRVLGYCTGEHADAAEFVWLALTRETPPPYVANAAALLALSALLRGDGPLANAALDRARQANPGHKLARLLRAFADSHLPPDLLRSALARP